MTEPLPHPSPAPFELPLDDTHALRGMIWKGDHPPVLFVHDLAEADDLDQWGTLPELVHRAGHTAIAIDLPGHGLSDGETSTDQARGALQRCVECLLESFGPRFFVFAAGAANRVLPPVALAALILLSPLDDEGAIADYPKLVFVGATDEKARAAADQYLRASRGWTLVSSFATSAQGTDLLQTDHGPRIAAQIVAFLRDYR